jgi:hypothetical protein
MNKKGFLLGEETVKIIIAVVAIVFLVALIVGLYTTISKNKDLEYATSTLDNLVGQINAKVSQVYIYNPKDWYLSSFPQQGMDGSSVLPQACSSVGWKSCLCIFKVGGDSLAKSVNSENSVCRENDFTVNGQTFVSYGGFMAKSAIVFKGIPLKDFPLSLSIDQETKTIERSDGVTQFNA